MEHSWKTRDEQMSKWTMVPRDNKLESLFQAWFCEYLDLTWVSHKQKQSFTGDLSWVTCYVVFKTKFCQAKLYSWAVL